MSEIVVRPIAFGDIPSYRDCVAAVAAEREWLAFQDPFPLSGTATFVARRIESGDPHFVAVDGDYDDVMMMACLFAESER